MSVPHPTNGEIIERIARLEAKLDAAMDTIEMRFKAAERADDAKSQVLDLRFKAQEKAVETAVASAERSSNKTDTATEKRFEGVNEFRKSLDDAARLNIPRSEAEGLIKAANDKIESVSKAANDKIESVSKAANDKIEQAIKMAHDKTEQLGKVLAEKVDRIGAEIIALNALVASSHSKRQGADEGKKEGYSGVAVMISGAIAVIMAVLAIASFMINMRR